MAHLYRCDDCGATFRATRKRCVVCGGPGQRTGRDSCRACDTDLVEAPVQQCPLCGSTDVETAAVRPD